MNKDRIASVIDLKFVGLRNKLLLLKVTKGYRKNL